MRVHVTSVLALGVVLLAACQDPDVGQPCVFQTGDGGVDLNVASVPSDFFASDPASGCDNLVCIKSPEPQSSGKARSTYCHQDSNGGTVCRPYCSKACVSNDDCFQSDTALECRPVAVDLNYVNSLPPDQRAQYYRFLGCQISDAGVATQCPLQFSSYCALPLQ